MSFTLEELDRRVAGRAQASPEESYTAQLIARGVSRCAQKLGEKEVEEAIAAASGKRAELTDEAGDVLYHLLVLLRASDVPLSDVMAALESRTGQSGLAEMASR